MKVKKNVLAVWRIGQTVWSKFQRKSHEADSTAEGDEQLEAKRLKASNGTSVHDGENGCTNGHNGETNGHSEVVMLNAEEAK